MTKMRRILWMTLLASVLLATAALARPVYLKSGEVVQAQKVWKEDGKIYALLNRDSLIFFYPDEVNLKKTFAAPTRHKAPAKTRPAARVAARSCRASAAGHGPPASSATACGPCSRAGRRNPSASK